jgi:EAL domain-containing protein (putative c-di-GMP-specific phosphodiesterase class I)
MRDIPSEPAAEAVVKSILSLGRNLGLDCIAEGVETRQQLDYLQKQMCTEMQGFLYSPALPEAECGALLRSGKPGFMSVPGVPSDRLRGEKASLKMVS